MYLIPFIFISFIGLNLFNKEFWKMLKYNTENAVINKAKKE